MKIEIQKVKITLLIFFLLIVFGISTSILAEENSLSKDNIFLDSDQDGLSDAEEISYGTNPNNQDTDGDGYSDGAEFKSGYDPLKPAPGDKLIKNDSENKLIQKINLEGNITSDNLTEELSSKVAALVSDSESGEGITMNDIDSMIDENIYSNTEEDIIIPEVDISKIKIKDQKYPNLSKEKRAQKIKEDDDEYTSTVLYIVSNNLPYDVESEMDTFSNDVYQKIGTLMSSPENMDYFNDLADRGNVIIDQIKDIEVPESMLDNHIELYRIANYAVSLKDKVKIDLEDPIASLVSLSSVESLLVMSSEFLEKMEQTSITSQDAIIEDIDTEENEKDTEIIIESLKEN